MTEFFFNPCTATSYTLTRGDYLAAIVMLVAILVVAGIYD